ncbi:MAG: PHP domain-containing protein [Clostridia bacterium]|nr:PHP domain-containing protein [Clostridia bacterium]
MKKTFKTELHAHTTPASSCSQITPEYMVEMYKNNGYTSVTITNHFVYDNNGSPTDKIKFYLDDFYKTKEIAQKDGINIILGAEIRFSENINDYLVYGIDENDLYKIEQLLGYGIDNFYKEFKNKRNIIIQAHPFRDNIVLANPQSIDGIEVFNMHPGHNSRIGFAAKHARDNNLIPICGSDYHHFGHEALCSIKTETPVKDSFELAQILNNTEYVMDISGFTVIPDYIRKDK